MTTPPAAPEIMDRTRAIERVCAAHRVELRAAALQFPLLHPSVTTVIPRCQGCERGRGEPAG